MTSCQLRVRGAGQVTGSFPPDLGGHACFRARQAWSCGFSVWLGSGVGPWGCSGHPPAPSAGVFRRAPCGGARQKGVAAVASAGSWQAGWAASEVFGPGAPWIPTPGKRPCPTPRLGLGLRGGERGPSQGLRQAVRIHFPSPFQEGPAGAPCLPQVRGSNGGVRMSGLGGV